DSPADGSDRGAPCRRAGGRCRAAPPCMTSLWRAGRRAREAAHGLLTHEGHDRPVDEQALACPLLDERRQEVLGEPFAADGDGAAEGDSVEVLVDPLCFARLRTAD